MMSRLRNLRVTTRLTGGFVAVCLLIAALECTAISGLLRVDRQYEEAMRELSWARAAMYAKAALLEEVKAQKNYLLRAEEEYLDLAQQHVEEFDRHRGELGSAPMSDAQRAVLARLDEQVRNLRAAFDRAVSLRRKGNVEAADAVMRGKAAAALATLEASVSSAQARATAAADTAREASELTKFWTIILAISIGALAIVLGIALSLSITRPVGSLRRAVDTVAAGGKIEGGSRAWFRDELSQVSDAFRELVERASLLRELETRSKRLEALSTRTSRAQEEQRRRTARELHDGLGQALTALKFEISVAQGRLRDRDDAAATHLGSARKLTDEAIQEVRRLTLDLRPPALDDLGLAAALGAYVRQYAERSPARVTFEAHNVEERLPRGWETALYRIAQEALANIAKHANATRVSVELSRDGPQVTLVVRDNGQGMDLKALSHGAPIQSGLGLLSMGQRAQELGGDFEIKSAPGKGTTIRVRLPRSKLQLDS